MLFGHDRDFFAQRVDVPAVWLYQSQRHFQDRALSRSRNPEDRFGLATRQAERDSVQNDLFLEGDRNVVERDHVFGRRRAGCSRSSRVTKTSTTMIRIIAATTASVVARPTPCVPPLVDKP